MEQSFIKYIYEFFKKLIEAYGFKIKTELNDGRNYMIEYSSDNFVIHIEKYFREFYVSVYKINNPDNGIDLFNLLEYLRRDSADVPTSDYFRKEKDLEECYRKQLKHVSTVIYENYYMINNYFSDSNYEARFADMRNFRKSKYPELYKKS